MVGSDVGPVGADLLVEILSRLPAKALFRFQCVSRSWRALIRDEIFPRKTWAAAASGLFFRCVIPPVRRDEMQHRVESGHAPLPPSMVVADDSDEANDLDFVGRANVRLDFLPRRENQYCVVGCRNGLLLCDPDHGKEEYYIHNSYQRADADLYVCNPATRRWVAVPKPFRSYRYSAVLAFDPRVSPHFRVAYLAGSRDQEQLSVFYAETGKWVHRAAYWEDRNRVFPGETTISRPEFRYGAVVVGEGLYVQVGEGEGLLARFDLSTGQYSAMKLPDGKRYGCHIGESQGHIHLAVVRSPWSEGDIEVDVWMLRGWQPPGGDSGDVGWVKKYDGINIHALALEQCNVRLWEGWLSSGSPQKSVFLGFHPRQDAIFILLRSRRIFACDLAERSLHEVCDVRNYDNRSVECRVFPFTPCPLGC